MKRAHESNLAPYQYRQDDVPQKNAINNQNNTITVSAPDLLTSLPCELLYQIFFDHLNLSFKILKSLAWTCKKWNTIIYSEDFKSYFFKIKEISIKFNENETWIKTYRQFLLTRTYILLDCSISMDDLKTKSYEIVYKIAHEVFKNNWWNGISLILFGNRYKFINVPNMSKLRYIFNNIQLHLLRHNINPNFTRFFPSLNKIYERVDKQDVRDASNSFLHVVSDCSIDDADLVVNTIRYKRCLHPLHIKFYPLGNYINAREFVSHLEALQTRVVRSDNRAVVSIVQQNAIVQET